MHERTWTLFTAPVDGIDANLLTSFMAQQQADHLFQESTTLELKRQISGTNVVKAIAALANTAGGVVLLGVDEDNPDFDSSPGVPADTHTRLIQQCETSMSPTFAPEIVPIAIPGTDRVVLVIRVEPDTGLLPVVVSGVVPVRQPGKSTPATHDQIIALVERRTSGWTGAQMLAVPSAFSPDIRANSTAPLVPDLTVRCATAMYGRLGTSRSLTLGAERRAQIKNALSSSALMAAPRAQLLPPQLHGWTPTFEDAHRSATRYATSCVVPTQEPHAIKIDVRVSGPQIAFAVDLDTRLRELKSPSHAAPLVQRSDAIAVCALSLLTVRDALMPVIASWLGGAPARVDDVTCWIETPLRSLQDAFDLAGTGIAQVTGARQWGGTQRLLEVPFPHGELSVLDALREPITRWYLDLGVDDEVALLRDDLDRSQQVIERVAP